MTIIYKMCDSHSTRFEIQFEFIHLLQNKADKSTNPNPTLTHIFENFIKTISIS